MTGTPRFGRPPEAGRTTEPIEPFVWLTPEESASMSDEEIAAMASPSRIKGVYVGAPACFLLELACRQINEAFDAHCYVVGSALLRPNWRDVDVRLIMTDEEFARLFPDAEDHWEFDPRWLILTTAISAWLSKVSGLPIDFQFQPQTHANERHPGPRNAMGLRFARKERS